MSKLLRLAAALCWLLLCLLALHKSKYPVVLGRYSSEYIGLLAAVGFAAVVVTLAATKHVTRFLARSKANLALMLASILFGVILTEGIIRQVDFLGVSMYQEVTRYMRDLIPDEATYYKHQPHFETTYRGVPVSFNEIGLRERRIGPKRAGTRRILLLGDSVTLGWGVPVEKTFGRRLEEKLRTASLETINSGVCGFNTSQELAFLRSRGFDFQPDSVLLLYVENDIDLLGPPPSAFTSMPNLISEPKRAAEYLLGKSWLYRILYHMAPVFLPVLSSAPPPAGDGWRNSMNALEEMARECNYRKIPLYVLLYRIERDAKTDALNNEIGPLADRGGFTFQDTLAWFEDRDRRSITLSFLDTHPNSTGHEILANGMAHLLSEGIAASAGR